MRIVFAIDTSFDLDIDKKLEHLNMFNHINHLETLDYIILCVDYLYNYSEEEINNFPIDKDRIIILDPDHNVSNTNFIMVATEYALRNNLLPDNDSFMMYLGCDGMINKGDASEFIDAVDDVYYDGLLDDAKLKSMFISNLTFIDNDIPKKGIMVSSVENPFYRILFSKREVELIIDVINLFYPRDKYYWCPWLLGLPLLPLEELGSIHNMKIGTRNQFLLYDDPDASNPNYILDFPSFVSSDLITLNTESLNWIKILQLYVIERYLKRIRSTKIDDFTSDIIKEVIDKFQIEFQAYMKGELVHENLIHFYILRDYDLLVKGCKDVRDHEIFKGRRKFYAYIGNNGGKNEEE